jgi:hypothetical protein
MTDQENAEQWLYIVELLDETGTNEAWTNAVKSWLPVMQANLSTTELAYVMDWLDRQNQNHTVPKAEPAPATWAELLRLLGLFLNKIRDEPLALLMNIIADLIQRINKKISRQGCKLGANEDLAGANDLQIESRPMQIKGKYEHNLP